MTAAIERIRRAGEELVGRTFELSLTRDYVSRWGMVHAVRELIQNALDSESPFVYEFALEPDKSWTLKLRSEFTTLTPNTLLLGTTSKAKAEDAIGSFGEGYKIALLVLTRLGHGVDIFNGDVLWRPAFRYSRAFGEDLLVVEESPIPDRANKGLTFVVRGLDDAGVAEVRASCLRMQENVGAIRQTEFGDILLDQPGRLYVGSLFVAKTQLKYGYDIKPRFIQLERDRQTVHDWDLKALTVKAWYATGDSRKVAELIAAEAPDVEHASYSAPEIIKEECYRIFRERHPHSLIAESPEQMRDMIKKGLVDTVYTGGGMYTAVSTSQSYRREVSEIVTRQMRPDELLVEWLDKYRPQLTVAAVEEFGRLVDHAKSWRIGR